MCVQNCGECHIHFRRNASLVLSLKEKPFVVPASPLQTPTMLVLSIYHVNSESFLSRPLIISREATKRALQKSSVTNCHRLSYLTKCAHGLSDIERSLSNCPPVPQFFPALQLIAPIYKRALSASTFYQVSYNSRTEPTCPPVKVGQSPNIPTGQSCKYTRCKYISTTTTQNRHAPQIFFDCNRLQDFATGPQKL